MRWAAAACLLACASVASAQENATGVPGAHERGDVAAEFDRVSNASVAPSSKRESRTLGMPSDTRAPVGRSRNGERGASAGSGTLRTMLALGAVVGVILGIGALARRLTRSSGGILAALGPGGRAPAGVLEILGRYPVGRGCTLILLKLDRRVLLVCQSSSRRGGNAMSTLCEVTDADEVASLLIKTRDETGEGVANRFHELLQKHEGDAFGTPRHVVELESARPARDIAHANQMAATTGAPDHHGVGALRSGLAGMHARRGGVA